MNATANMMTGCHHLDELLDRKTARLVATGIYVWF